MRGVMGLVAWLAMAGGVQAATYELSPEGNARYLADFAALKGVTKLADGLMYRVLEAGPPGGVSPVTRFDTVTVDYKGWLINGKVFDRSRPNEPRSFTAGGVIPGWREALMKMKTGETWQLVIPADLAYGEDGLDNVIPPNQTLVFTVRLNKVEYAP